MLQRPHEEAGGDTSTSDSVTWATTKTLRSRSFAVRLRVDSTLSDGDEIGSRAPGAAGARPHRTAATSDIADGERHHPPVGRDLDRNRHRQLRQHRQQHHRQPPVTGRGRRRRRARTARAVSVRSCLHDPAAAARRSRARPRSRGSARRPAPGASPPGSRRRSAAAGSTMAISRPRNPAIVPIMPGTTPSGATWKRMPSLSCGCSRSSAAAIDIELRVCLADRDPVLEAPAHEEPGCPAGRQKSDAFRLGIAWVSMLIGTHRSALAPSSPGNRAGRRRRSGTGGR